MIHCIEFLERN